MYLVIFSGVGDNHSLDHVPSVFNPVGGYFQQLVDFFPADKFKNILTVRDQVGQAFMQHPVTVIFQGIDLHNALVNLGILFLVAQHLHRRLRARWRFPQSGWPGAWRVF